MSTQKILSKTLLFKARENMRATLVFKVMPFQSWVFLRTFTITPMHLDTWSLSTCFSSIRTPNRITMLLCTWFHATAGGSNLTCCTHAECSGIDTMSVGWLMEGRDADYSLYPLVWMLTFCMWVSLGYLCSSCIHVCMYQSFSWSRESTILMNCLN